MKFILYCCLLVVTSIGILAQNLVQYEYYFDTDPGIGNATTRNFTNDDPILLIDSVEFSNFEPGIHRFCVRFKDEDGNWSLSACRILYVDQFSVANINLVASEYFIGVDPGMGNATPLTIDEAEQLLLLDSVPFTNLDFGFHRLCFRFINSNNTWSGTVCRLFYVDRLFDYVPPMLTNAEYYINTDPGFGNATQFTINPAYDILVIDSINLAGISKGFHTFCFRFKNADGVWTPTICRNFAINEFVIPDAEVVAGEFWLGNDPGMGNAKPIRFIEPGLQAIMLDQADLDGLASGVHNIYSRARNNLGVWGPTFSKEFTISNQGVPRLIYPPDMATEVEIIPTTDWTAVPTATSYKVQISTDFVEFDDNIMFSKNVPFVTELVIPEGTLDTGKTYYWRVNAIVGGNPTDWSGYFTFTTKDDLVKFVIQLAQGWNMISSNTESDVTNLEAVTSGIADKMVIMKDNLGNIYYPQFEIDMIENWNVTQGYQVFMSQAANLSIWGKSIDPTVKTIHLNSGWNMISYLRNSNMAPETALNSMVQAGVLVIMKDNLGNIYYPDFEIDTIELMRPGQGYQMFLLSPFNLNYPAN